MTKERTCFIISPIGDQESDTRKRSDQVLKHIIKPALETCGYKGQRADELDKPGMITSQVIQRIVNDDLVLADLSDKNPNVFYELAIRHAFRKPFIQLIKKGEQIPFDVAGARTIQFDHKDLDSVAEAKQEIVNQIKELEKTPDEIDSPISVSIELQMLRQSEKPEDRSFAELLSLISELRASVIKLESKTVDRDNIDSILNDHQKKLVNLFGKLERLLSPVLNIESVQLRTPNFFKFQNEYIRLPHLPPSDLTLSFQLAHIKHVNPVFYDLTKSLLTTAKTNNKANLKLLDEYNILLRRFLDFSNLRIEEREMINMIASSVNDYFHISKI